ncbi:zinc-binding dehydrogenase [Pseudonocardia sp.]|uniref:zinc-binding dehydrogenase n=1 Tax=Pseudonocardia sp. TaxID=60912 RepID=UPI003D14C8F4
MTPTMKAAILEEGADSVKIEEVPRPKPGRGEVLLKVAGCGICRSDLSVVRGHIPVRRPCVPGHEVSGVVAEHGPGVHDAAPAVGDMVTSAFVLPCSTCVECAAGRDDLCRRFFAENRALGVLYDGTSRLRRADGTALWMFSMSGMAEYAVIPASSVFTLPPALPLVESAVVGCAMFTAYGAVRRTADLRVGETVAVVAAGGVGSNIVQLARAFGASRVIAVDVGDDKLAAARRLGATDVVNSREVGAEAAVRDLTGGLGVDVAFEALGHPATFTEAISLVRDGGRMVSVGLSTESAQVPINRVVRSRVAVLGSYGARTRTDMPALLRLLGSGAVRSHDVVTRRVALEDLNDSLDALEQGQIVGRAVVDLSDDGS